MYKLYNTQEDFASNLNEFLKNSVTIHSQNKFKHAKVDAN